MNTVKTFIKYIIWIILFWILSDFLINVGLKSTYKEMQKVEQIPSGIQVKEIKSTAVNGKINLIVNSTNLGTQYLEIGEIKENQTKEIDTYFKIADVKKYKISVTDEKGEATEGFMDTAMSAITIVFSVIKLLILI